MSRSKWWGIIGTASFLALAAGPTDAGVTPNGLMPNGLMPNGLMPNGLMPNGLMPNGLMPNGLMPNGLTPNGLMPNGLMPNGLMPNGLMPNGLTSYAIHGGIHADVDGTDFSFDQWFALDPASRDNFMKYFVRCAYDTGTEITYADATGKTWRWTGGIGFAMTTLKAGLQMTRDEGRWISTCVLAFVNIKGEHQYISLRGSPPNPEAQAALAPTANELLFMPSRFGMFFADLGTAGQASVWKGACRYGSMDVWTQAKPDLVLGRSCDVNQCSYTDRAGATVNILNTYFSGCMDGWNHWPGSPLLTFYKGDTIANLPNLDGVQVASHEGLYRPLLTYGPDYIQAVTNGGPVLGADGRTVIRWEARGFGFRSASSCVTDVRLLAPRQALCTEADRPFTARFDPAQTIECGTDLCLGGNPFDTTSGYGIGKTFAMVDMVAGQAADFSQGGPTADVTQPVTALVRYSKDRTASAHVLVNGPHGEWNNVSRWNGGEGDEEDDDRGEGREWGDRGMRGGGGADIWPATGAGQWEWLQVYPVYIRPDASLATSPGRGCASDADCAPGLGLTCWAGGAARGATCVKDALSTTDAAGQASWYCDGAAGQLQLYEKLLVARSSTPACVEQCTLDSQCQAGDSCLAGRCTSPLARIRLAGAAMSQSCTGQELFRGAGEQGQCSKSFPKGPRKNLVCPRKYEVGAPCLGSLVYGERQGTWGWFCRGGGEALYQCLADDAPAIDGVGFVPTRPWCMPASATSFVGVCK